MSGTGEPCHRRDRSPRYSAGVLRPASLRPRRLARAGRRGARLLAAAVAPALVAPTRARAQALAQPLTRAGALEIALSRGPRVAAAAADTEAALAQLRTAAAFANPTLTASYSKAVPRVHAIVDYPLVDALYLRRGRTSAATALRAAASYRLAPPRAAILLDVDTSYTRAVAADSRARLSRRTAADGLELRRIAQARRDAGDAADLDVRLASVSAGQLLNAAAADSLAAVGALLNLQAAMGLSPDTAVVALADSLGDPPVLAADGRPPNTSGSGREAQPPAPPLLDQLLPVAAAQAALASARVSTRVAQLGRLGLPSVTFGVEGVDPSGAERGPLPTVGLSVPLPFLSRNRGLVDAARAEEDRAAAQLAVARLDAAGALARARRERVAALTRLARDRALVGDAERVAAMALQAYQEGASPLPNVIQARRDARDLLAQSVEDVAAAWNATAALRVASLTTARPTP